MLTKENYNDGYYHLGKDLEDYPAAWCHVVWSRRGPGKTYSGLRYYLERNKAIVYVKRTVEDVELICSNSASEEYDFSPYSPLNRDFGYNIKARMVKKGVGAFYHCDEDSNPIGQPVAYVIALNGVAKAKGFELSHCEAIIFDEFIPQAGEIVRAGEIEGSQMLSLYMTVNRDRPKRGLKPIRLILFANSENISTPVTNILEIVDDMADMNAFGQAHLYIEEREIHLHYITTDEVPIQEEEKQGIYKGMQGTAWFDKAFIGSFTSNDFSNVVKRSLKGYKPLIEIKHKNKHIFIYLHPATGKYFLTYSKGKALYYYDLNKENDQKGFYLNHVIDLKAACIDDRVKFEKFSMYDLLINYKKFFKV